MFVREADLAYNLGPGVGPSLPRPRGPGEGAARHRSGRRLGRLGVRRRGPGVRRAVRPDRRHLHRPERRGDAHGSATRSARSCSPRRSASRSRRGAAAPLDTLEAAHRQGRRDRLPGHAQGHRRRRRPRHPPDRVGRGDGGRLRAHPRRGRARLRQRRGLPREPGHRRAARRGAGHRRRPGHGVGARRPRLLGPAPQPEGHRGVVVAGAVRGADGASSRPAPSGWPSRSATPAPAPSSSSTTRAASTSRSSRSTPGCRSSTRSPR